MFKIKIKIYTYIYIGLQDLDVPKITHRRTVYGEISNHLKCVPLVDLITTVHYPIQTLVNIRITFLSTTETFHGPTQGRCLV